MPFFDHLKSLGWLEDVETLGSKDLQYITGEESSSLSTVTSRAAGRSSSHRESHIVTQRPALSVTIHFDASSGIPAVAALARWAAQRADPMTLLHTPSWRDTARNV